METFDRDDRQPADQAALDAAVVCGRRMYKSTKNAVMEDLCYDATMPVDAPLWMSIDEGYIPEPPAAQPVATPDLLPKGSLEAFAEALGGNKVAACVALAVLPALVGGFYPSKSA